MNNKSTFIVAVSGGVDSVVLLHKLISRQSLNQSNPPRYVVAHFNHGIRDDSHKDAELVRELAKKYDLDFELGEGKLSENVSEAEARKARYQFLREIKQKYKADKIILAHHQDDVIETMIMNILRGTGPRGLNPMQGYDDLLRPLIHRRKSELIDYANEHNLKWIEDSTNSDEKYKRNYIRRNIMPKIESKIDEFLNIKTDIESIYQEVDMRLSALMPKKNIISRVWFLKFPYKVQKEIIRNYLVSLGLDDIDSRTIERLTVSVKTLQIGKKTDISGKLWLVSEKENLLITSK
jgi:tRNA(Ile)-lysidine synthetase-like protein